MSYNKKYETFATEFKLYIDAMRLDAAIYRFLRSLEIDNPEFLKGIHVVDVTTSLCYNNEDLDKLIDSTMVEFKIYPESLVHEGN